MKKLFEGVKKFFAGVDKLIKTSAGWVKKNWIWLKYLFLFLIAFFLFQRVKKYISEKLNKKDRVRKDAELKKEFEKIDQPASINERIEYINKFIRRYKNW